MTSSGLRAYAENHDRAAIYQELIGTGLFDEQHAENMTDSLIGTEIEMLADAVDSLLEEEE